ncbi:MULTISPECIES: TenA family protein [unclassified Ensifer]|uniref:TenA family protein n=1 Tax=unclassified Ensifer TaxID=2633371 RepID=UPI0007130307|nr:MULTISPECIES: TenA family protein [unclassified Ensifer]KQX44948.1 TenA family transcriptional regulator [Ensifer sp. Root1298]KQX76790.1 TenA family transcriptional regulator [Ensifer sp. Root1312]KRC17301.1 TenA family transcriptional regulator [Ensifer sp. Root74]KRD62331.1 TenA family transcriptional regulator [Ensifer sp. Root954]
MAAETLSEQILRENATVFEAMVNHRFVEDIVMGRLSPQVFERYLVYEGAFVESAISIFAFAAAKAETIEQKRWLIAVLDALANQQIAYFERIFAERNINPGTYDLNVAEVDAFRTGMLDIARNGGFLDTVAAMFAAEWMYWTWSKRAARSSFADPHLKEWVEMHADDEFAAQAKWLKKELDVAGDALEASERKRLSAIFGRAQQLEIAFHDAAYV